MNRDLLAAEAEGYRKGREELMKEYDHGFAVIRAGTHIYLLSSTQKKNGPNLTSVPSKKDAPRVSLWNGRASVLSNGESCLVASSRLRDRLRHHTRGLSGTVYDPSRSPTAPWIPCRRCWRDCARHAACNSASQFAPESAFKFDPSLKSELSIRSITSAAC